MGNYIFSRIICLGQKYSYFTQKVAGQSLAEMVKLGFPHYYYFSAVAVSISCIQKQVLVHHCLYCFFHITLSTGLSQSPILHCKPYLCPSLSTTPRMLQHLLPHLCFNLSVCLLSSYISDEHVADARLLSQLYPWYLITVCGMN